MLGLVCRFIGHRRSKRDASFDVDHGWRSFCSRCHVPMIRIAKGVWEVDPKPREYLRGHDRGSSRGSGR